MAKAVCGFCDAADEEEAKKAITLFLIFLPIRPFIWKKNEKNDVV